MTQKTHDELQAEVEAKYFADNPVVGRCVSCSFTIRKAEWSYEGECAACNGLRTWPISGGRRGW